MARRRIIISFKETPEDIKLYEDIKKHSDQSAYVKDVLKGILKNEKNAERIIPIIENKVSNSEIEDILGM